jgi:hypothetical protein
LKFSFFRLAEFIEMNEDSPPVTSPPPADLNEARIQDDDDEEDFFGGAAKLSQELRGQGEVQQTGLLGLEGPATPLKIELDSYFKLPPLPKAKMDVLEWWKVQEPAFPLLADIARKFLCVPASSSPSERLFSASGNICTRLRSSLDPTNLELLVYVHENGNKIKMTYDSTLIPTAPAQAQAQPQPDPVNID